MKRLFLINDKPIDDGYGGGRIVRQSQRTFFEYVGYKVWEIAPVIDRENSIDLKKGVIYIRQNGAVLKGLRILQKFNLIEDYLNLWIQQAVKYVEQIIKAQDIIFCFSGGGLSTIKLGSILKKKIGCKFVINLHDPLLYTLVNDYFIVSLASKLPQRNRDYLERKYLRNSDLILTSSESYSKALLKKYPHLNIECCHFGYHEIKKVHKRTTGDTLHIVYGGSFSEIQKPEILMDAVLEGNIPNVKVHLLGDHHRYARLNKYKKQEFKHMLNFKEQMSSEDYQEFVNNQIDVGFFSLVGSLSELCVPSKLYEYINLEIPVLGVINGDGKQIINDNKIGIVCTPDKEDIIRGIGYLKDIENLAQAKKNIKKIKPDWSLEAKYQKALNLINQL